MRVLWWFIAVAAVAVVQDVSALQAWLRSQSESLVSTTCFQDMERVRDQLSLEEHAHNERVLQQLTTGFKADVGFLKPKKKVNLKLGKRVGLVTVKVADVIRQAPVKKWDTPHIMFYCYQQAALHLGKQKWSAQTRADAVMAICSAVLNSPQQLYTTNRVVHIYEAIYAWSLKAKKSGRKKGHICAGFGIDKTIGKGQLDKRLNDKTDNQPFHTNFFITAGYVAGKSVVSKAMVMAGNIKHEVWDGLGGGGSYEDFFASAIGQVCGSMGAKYYRSQSKGFRLLAPLVWGAVAKTKAVARFPKVPGVKRSKCVAAAKRTQKHRDSKAWALKYNPIRMGIAATTYTGKAIRGAWNVGAKAVGGLTTRVKKIFKRNKARKPVRR